MHGQRGLGFGIAIGIALAAATCAAAAQNIEISSPSIGTVKMRAPTYENGATSRNAATARARSSTGVDLGIRRNPDGTLYDALDPRQNPAAATMPESTSAEAPAPQRRPGSQRSAAGDLPAGDFPYGVNAVR